MEERITKLFILPGDEGIEHEVRDFRKINEIIVNEYLSKNDEQITSTIVTKFTHIISLIPLKYHIYAGLTAKINLFNKEISNQIIHQTINNLQKYLSEFEFFNCLNILAYLSELMNISLLNSLTFINILEDIQDKIEATENANTKKFYVSVLIRSLPVCINSLSEKLPQDLKNFMDSLESHADNDALLVYLRKIVNKGKTVNYSLMSRLGQSFTGLQQFHVKRKLKFEPNEQKQSQWRVVQYFNLARSSQDELYKQFAEEQGRFHQITIQHLVETFYSRNSILYLKLLNYLNSIPLHKAAFVYQFTISCLISKSLKSSRPIVQQSLLLSLINGYEQKMSEQSTNLTKAELSQILQSYIIELFQKGENLDFNSIINVANLISFVINGFKREVDWQKFIDNEESFVKRRILLILIIEKTKLLNDNFVLPECFEQFPHYEIQEKLTNQIEFKTAEEMQVFQSFQNALKSKSPSQTINQMIKNEHDYEVFLQALFRRTALSQTHLKTLIQRYKEVLVQNHEHDWALINKIRNFWKKSYLNRQTYLQLMIKKQFITFNSYVNYIGQLKDKNQREMIWIKVELNQLNNIFGGQNASKKKIYSPYAGMAKKETLKLHSQKYLQKLMSLLDEQNYKFLTQKNKLAIDGLTIQFAFFYNTYKKIFYQRYSLSQFFVLDLGFYLELPAVLGEQVIQSVDLFLYQFEGIGLDVLAQIAEFVISDIDLNFGAQGIGLSTEVYVLIFVSEPPCSLWEQVPGLCVAENSQICEFVCFLIGNQHVVTPVQVVNIDEAQRKVEQGQEIHISGKVVGNF